MPDREPEPRAPAPLRGIGRVLAPIWVIGIVLLYLAVRELGLQLVP